MPYKEYEKKNGFRVGDLVKSRIQITHIGTPHTHTHTHPHTNTHTHTRTQTHTHTHTHTHQIKQEWS